MCQNLKPISISLSPNVQRDDVFLVIKILLRSLLRKSEIQNSKSKTLEDGFKKYLGVKYAFSFNSGRSSLYTILKALNIKEGDEVLLQAFTCNAVPNPVLWVRAKPVYADIDESLNIDPDDLEKKITKNGKAIIIQNTFGIPAQVDKIVEIARRHNLIVIEDCAHALGAKYQRKKLGTFGDVAFFSFGRDKVISSVWGGIVTANNDEIAKKIEMVYKDVPYPKRMWAIKQLLHPVLFTVIIPTYYVFGKYLLAFLRASRGIGLAVSQKERMGERPDMFPARMPEEIAAIALHQFDKLEKYNAHRKKIAELYFRELSHTEYLGRRMSHIFQEGAIYLRFNILTPDAKKIIRKAKKKHILLGDWYKNIIDPIGTDFEKMGYVPGSCPNAEKVARESVNLPTHINISERNAMKIIEFLKNELSGNK